ncbi:MAG: WYL domain-containing protein [Chloroflexi bacterium AL-W]|nr:WYL domain-containing protein [Chloroflexi bacterium AL-N1]NOK65536.1 WYL domain-containing protein [Chloroflexi bacterium AL-N10]NOK74522.1 WYL domain-containing protein [Chloroflexi bacterium AL-N5]NOK80569.1 WYL domain-containing protein [Chloroflexi bacterium AL-W]NOK88780.1 WYL domain-containing protein [Chloroflexi bacterium AL-N15]
MTQRQSGPKRSSWLIFRRRLILVRQLMRGPATRDQLWESIAEEMVDEAWGNSPESALRHDIQALRREFGCTIRHRTASGYHLEDLGQLYLLDLTDDHLQAIHTLTTIAETLPPHVMDNAASLLAHLISFLPPDRRTLRTDPSSEHFITSRSVTDLDRTMLRRIRRAIRHQQLQFRYYSTHTTTHEGVEHRVAPYRLVVRDAHLYLDADCLWNNRNKECPKRQLYRIERIDPASLQVLTKTVPPLRTPTKRYTLRYELAPEVARRRDIADHFEGNTIEYRDDGSALITVTIDNLWWARQTLLRYREHCRVLEPPELIDMFHETLQNWVDVYKK